MRDSKRARGDERIQWDCRVVRPFMQRVFVYVFEQPEANKCDDRLMNEFAIENGLVLDIK